MKLDNYISAKNRERKYKLFEQHFAVDENTTILDIGYTSSNYTTMENYLEKHYPYPENITALGVEDPTLFQERFPMIKAIQYDGSIFPFPDKQFDIAWSNAVIEHVGDRDQQVLFLSEIKRVARSAYITTPNIFFPIEVHTKVPLLHFILPKTMFDRVLTCIGKSWATGSYMYLLSYNNIKSLLHDAGITDYLIHKNRICGLTMDFSIIMRF